ATCAQHNSRWKQRLNVDWQWADGWQQLPAPVQQHLQMHAHAAWQQQVQRPGRWLWHAQAPRVEHSSYSQALLQPATPRSEGLARMSVSVIQPAAGPSTTWLDRVVRRSAPEAA
ncbi:hypothetical protein RZS08_46575, partial [Arthrospira platensis SPKY1]|nr:hypothetical protein [Arthrospira platensis SPKY1]